MAERRAGMKLISHLDPMPEERRNAYPPEEARGLVKESFGSSDSIEGMDELRHGLILDTETEVLSRLESGDWLLINEKAYYFDNSAIVKQAKEQRAMDLMNSPPPQPRQIITQFRILDSETREPITSRNFATVTDGQKGERRTDSYGVAHISKPQEEVRTKSILFRLLERRE
jgi:hypothetical protein